MRESTSLEGFNEIQKQFSDAQLFMIGELAERLGWDLIPPKVVETVEHFFNLGVMFGERPYSPALLGASDRAANDP